MRQTFVASLTVLAGLLGAAAAQGPDVAAAPDDATQATLAVVGAFAQDHDASRFAPDAVFHDATLPEPITGRDAIAAMFDAIYAVGFPDANPTVERITASGDRAVIEFRFEGTNTGPLFGHEPTGRAVSVPMAAVYQVEDGAIREGWLYYDAASYAAQIGWTP